MSWFSKYVEEEIPYVEGGRDPQVGLDCWGLVMWVAGDMGVELPDLNNPMSLRRSALYVAVNDTQPKDFLLFRNRLHTGVVVRKGLMLHCFPGVGVVLERFDNAGWMPRLLRTYRLNAAYA